MFRKRGKGRIDWKINRTAQDTIPYHRVHEKQDLIETEPNVFCRAYLLEDLNFSTSKVEDQELMFRNYQSLLNSFPVNVRVQVSIINKNIDKNEFKDEVLMKYEHDGLDNLREELNAMLINKMEQGKNNLTHEKLLIASVDADSVEEAFSVFRQVDNIVTSGVKKVGGLMSSTTKVLTAAEYLEVLHDIYNPKLAGQFNAIRNIDGEVVSSFSFKDMARQGLTTKDLIAPDSFQFKSNHFMVGDSYGRALYIERLPSFLSTSVLSELASNETNQIISLNYTQMDQTAAIKTVERHITALNAERIEKQKRGSKGGYDGDLIGHQLVEEVNSAKEFLSDMSTRNQKLFLLTGTIVVFGDTEDELNKYTELIKNKARRYLIYIQPLRYQQEQGLSQSLPLARKDVFVERTMNTEAAAIFMPYDTQEFSHKGGRYYGVNATSRNLVIYDRKTAANQNGFILGVPGSGKSFIAKAEMVGVALGTKDDIVVVDPESEYGALAELLGGKTVPISLGSENHINPLDMADDYGDGKDPIPAKSDFITQLVETIVGNKYSGLTPGEKSIIDRGVKQVYEPYFKKLSNVEREGLSDKEFNDYRRSITPTLSDFRDVLASMTEHEAQSIVVALEQYTVGSFNLFSKQTNVDNQDRFVVYDTSGVGKTIMPLAMMIMMDAIWNRILENRDRGRNTWVYIDEIYLMFRSEESAELLQNMWKRARKYGGINTGITQNVEDLLQSSTASTMLSNSEFVLMMNQSTLDRENLIALLNISETQSSYITSAEPGQGLLYTGRAIVPFINKFPTDTDLYKVMTSKIEEVDRYRREREADDNEHRGTKEETSN